MAQVKVLLCKIGFLTALIILTSYIIMVIGIREDDYWNTAIDKHKLLKATRSPKIILVGGSNVAFSLDSKIIQHQLGVPVVNTAITIQLGLKYMLEEVRPFIGQGDIVVVMPEYEQFYGATLNGNQYVWTILSHMHEGYRNLQSPGQYLALLKSFPIALASKSRVILDSWATALGISETKPNDIFRRSLFNDQGDFVGHLSLPPQWNGTFSKPNETLNKETFSFLEKFSKYAASKKAQMIVVWPSVPEPFYLARKEWIQRIASKMAEYPDIKVDGIPLDYSLPVNNFFDSYYHLGADGRRKKSLAILRLLLQMNGRPLDN